MIGKVQDLVSAAVVVKAADTAASGGAKTEALEASSPVDEAAKVELSGAEKGAAREKPKGDEPEHKMDEKAVDLMTEELNELMEKIDCDLKFKYDKDVDMMSVKMVSKETEEVIKEFPPEEMVKNIKQAREWIGAFLDRNA